MTQSLIIAMAQRNFRVGSIPENSQQVVHAAQQAAEAGAQLVVFSELALTGYPPEDLLLRPSLQVRVEQALSVVAAASHDIAIAIGYPLREQGKLYNCAAIWHQGQCLGVYRKRYLPNYQVFDEQRYFTSGCDPLVIDLLGHRIALTVCEDIWHDEPVADSVTAGAELILNLNASPFHSEKALQREQLVSAHARRYQVPIVYVNQVGGQDELVFDGHSFAVDATGHVFLRLPSWQPFLGLWRWEKQPDQIKQCQPLSATTELNTSALANLYQALMVGLRDYVHFNGFKGVILGLSGGIDSALSLAIAVDALGAECVQAVMMPFAYTSSMSKDDAAEQAERMGVGYQSLSIEPMYDAFMATLTPSFAGFAADTTEENLQSRCRAVLLMALSNKTGAMVLTTGNKSELAVGYATLYGDMCGGYNALKDVYKTQVFELARYRNELGYVIPQRVIDRPPSAELAPDQRDEDSLPAYPILDALLHAYIEQDLSADDLIAQGFVADDVYRVLRLVDMSEYKRRQAPIGVRVSQRGFGRDRRYPITQGWRAGL